MKNQFDGFDWIAGNFVRGEYSTGSTRLVEMEDVLAKGCAFRSIHCGDRRWGWGFYCRTLGGQTRNGQWKFIVGHPLMLITGGAPVAEGIRRQKKQTISEE